MVRPGSPAGPEPGPGPRSPLGLVVEAHSDPAPPPVSPRSGSEGIYREEALRHHARGRSDGDLLRLSPVWTGRAFLVVLALMAAVLLFVSFGRINEYAAGRAMVRLAERIELTMLASATCSSLDVRPGDRVLAGQILARFHEGPQAAELERAEREFELLLIELLTHPGDPGVRQSLARLRSDRNWARSRLDEQRRRAPCDGVVRDVRVRPGQFVEAGEVFMTLRGDSSGVRVVALLPGRYGPELHAGMDLRLELDGYPYAYQRFAITDISGEALGPDAVRRVLGREAGQALSVTEPVVIATVTVPAGRFRARGREHDYTDGMQGRAEVRLRSQRILTAMLPGLRELIEGRRD